MTDVHGGLNEEVSEAIMLKHLDYIHSIVARMSHSSMQAKSWLLPVSTATFGYALTKQSEAVALLGIAAILLFGYVDACYLRQERMYRQLYSAVVAQRTPTLSLNPHDINRNILKANGDPLWKEKSDEELGFWKNLWGAFCGWFFFDPRVWFSWSIFPFYGGFFAVGIVVFLFVYTH